MLKINDTEFHYLVDYLKSNFGINLAQKRVLLEGRLSNYIIQNDIATYADYIEILKKDKTGRELTNLLNKVTTNHTYFMREAEHFEFLRDSVLPFMEGRVRNRDFRLWCAAASTGEEPYTLAMILQDYFGSKSPKWDKTLLATDISQRALDMAKQGVYPGESIEKIPEKWRRQYFKAVRDGGYQVKEDIKSQVIYTTFNLMHPIRYKQPFHVIFCRNVMIYFDAPTKAAVIDRMYDALVPGGYFFIGQTESIAKPTRFNYVKPSVYQKGY